MFKRFIQHCVAAGLANTTINSYCFALKDYWQWLNRNKVSVVDKHIIETYFVYLRGKQYAAATIRDKYAVLHRFYAWCTKEGYYKENPVQIPKPKVSGRARCFTDEEVLKILTFYKDKSSFTCLRDYTIMCLLFSTGMRRAELLSITQVQRDFITVTGKGGKTRCVPVSATLRQVLDKYIVERNKRAVCPNLIVTNRGTKMTTNGLRAVFTRLARGTGITGKRFSPHTMRHTFATTFLQNGGDIGTLQQILGHSDISTTAVYLHWNDETTKKINDKVNPLNNFRFFL